MDLNNEKIDALTVKQKEIIFLLIKNNDELKKIIAHMQHKYKGNGDIDDIEMWMEKMEGNHV